MNKHKSLHIFEYIKFKMAETTSNMLPLGTEAPNFKLWDTVSDSIKSLNKLPMQKTKKTSSFQSCAKIILDHTEQRKSTTKLKGYLKSEAAQRSSDSH